MSFLKKVLNKLDFVMLLHNQKQFVFDYYLTYLEIELHSLYIPQSVLTLIITVYFVTTPTTH